MKKNIPKYASWCSNCLCSNTKVFPPCPYHANGEEDYEGIDAYEPSEHVLRIVGKFYDGPEGTYECTGYDPRNGFWMRDLDKPDDLRNISERAIGRTFNERRPKIRTVNIMGSKGLPKEAVVQFPNIVETTPNLKVYSAVHERMIGCAYGFRLLKGDIWAEVETDKHFGDFDIAAGAVAFEDGVMTLTGIVLDSSSREVP